ncbi:unnamed protein product [Nesidiocoris tenuis]|uniref:Uncharacterized protein n=1 Tax=Nesidiocoris tenuis TaxID=355587 RepID=A0A6H5GL66_9HEMI|nr:unnamed protein product [Nesidiocoris tenuis]
MPVLKKLSLVQRRGAIAVPEARNTIDRDGELPYGSCVLTLDFSQESHQVPIRAINLENYDFSRRRRRRRRRWRRRKRRRRRMRKRRMRSFQ